MIVNKNGLTLIEVLISLGILAFIIAVSYGAYTSQYQSYEIQKMVAGTTTDARMALHQMARQIRLGRSGADPAISLEEACQCRIRLGGNYSNTSTYLSTDHAAGTTTLAVNALDGFQVGDPIYITDWTQWRVRTIASLTATPPTIVVAPAVDIPFSKGSFVHKYQEILFALDPATMRVMKNTTLPLAENVNGAGGFQLRYFDGADVELPLSAGADCTTRCLTAGNRSQVRKITMALTLRTPRATNPVAGTPSTITLHTSERLRNPLP